MKRKTLKLILPLLAVMLAGYAQEPVLLTVAQSPALIADAGTDAAINSGQAVTIGGNPSASLGYGGYVYLWSPAEGLDDPTVANPSASPGATTTYLLTVTDAMNCTSTDEVTVTVGSSGTGDARIQPQVHCYPNPVADELLVELTGMPSGLTIRLLSPLGKELALINRQAPGTSAIERIPMHHLPGGVYFLQVISDDAVHFETILKAR